MRTAQRTMAMVAMATTAATADTPQAMAMARHMPRHMVKDMAIEARLQVDTTAG